MLPVELIQYAGRLFNCSAKDIIADNRRVPVHRARMALYLVFWTRAELRGARPSYKGVGRLMGGRDHSTVIHGLKRARALAEADSDFAKHVLTLVMAKELPPVKKKTCNTELQVVAEPDQQPEETKVPTPEETEQTLNSAFRRAGLKALSAYWDGNIVSAADPAKFDVYFNDNPTDFCIRVTDGVYTVYRNYVCSFRPLGCSDAPSAVADIVREQFYSKQEEAA